MKPSPNSTINWYYTSFKACYKKQHFKSTTICLLIDLSVTKPGIFLASENMLNSQSNLKFLSNMLKIVDSSVFSFPAFLSQNKLLQSVHWLSYGCWILSNTHSFLNCWLNLLISFSFRLILWTSDGIISRFWTPSTSLILPCRHLSHSLHFYSKELSNSGNIAIYYLW